MDKKEYFEISKEEGLPKRCPILNYCKRRAITIKLFSDLNESELKELLPQDYEDKVIKFQGEVPVSRENKNDFINCCPEVNLFGNEHSLPPFKGKAYRSGVWNSDSSKIVNEEFAHFSECAEFSKYDYEQKLK